MNTNQINAIMVISRRAGAPMIKPQIIERDGKPEDAVIPVAEWRRGEATREELEDIRTLDAVMPPRRGA